MSAIAGAPEQDPGAPARATRGRILLVEDEPALVRALRINLRARNYDVETASAGRAALAVAARHPPDAVILDLGLPDVDGIEVIRELRHWSRAPVIVLSGRAGPGDKIGALDAGADDYVTKPFSMEELLARLRAVLRREDSGPHGPQVRIGRCEVDFAAHVATRQAGRGRTGSRCGSLRPSGGCWRSWSSTLASWSARPGCSPTCGGQESRTALTTCASTWPGCGGNWRTTRPGPGIC
jgi:CheY-like chemotaxis protein